MKYLVLTLRKPEFRDDVLAAHHAFLAGLRADGKLEAAGAFTDRTGGAYLLKAEGLADARALASQDPLHVENCSEVSVREWDAR